MRIDRLAAMLSLSLSVALVLAGCVGPRDQGPTTCTAETMTTATCTPPPADAAPGKKWKVIFEEQFDGSDYDRTKLTPCFDWNFGGCTSSFNSGRETYRPEQVRVGGGYARLVGEPLVPPSPDPACFQSVCTYKSGMLSTARPDARSDKYLFSFTYGYTEARVKFPAVAGFFTAFWMLPTNPQYEYRSEIDIVEALGGNPQNMFMTYAYDGRSKSYRVNKTPSDNGACPVRDYAQDWVRFGVDWEPDHIAWYINGVRCGEFTDAGAIENGPMQLILNMTIDNDWERNEGSTLADLSRTAELDVDYLRVFQQQ
ncbi:family 16 glycosylhydrolase [Nocardia sp. ET3-3]|uniref:Family 16 glycosylhydrolase n=1 Tax=Nocardia terrae TaxID=2675851 RepID=A0A7K1USK9_9NOCA|nr:glycoside hydrolase family 16 protein [Nocardia terrae]MVU77332.1 family 16 glycosylhydrolase [Nocardia terrae]